jgi:transporter family-2 protein
LGATFVTSNLLLTPRIGVAAVVALAIAWQVIASLLLDRHGFLGMTVRELSPGRLAGAVMVVAGALMVRFL